MSVIPAEGFPFEPDRSVTTPLWVQLRNRIAFLITSGRFKADDQLPKIRELATEVSMNFNTVNRAYMALASDGYVRSVRGRGVFVCDVTRTEDQVRRDEVEAVLLDCLKSCRSLGMTYDDALDMMSALVKRLNMSEAEPRAIPGSNIIELRVPEPAVEREA